MRAKRTLNRTLFSLLEGTNPRRFRKAALLCKCKHCGKAEPWAMMNYEHLEIYRAIGYSISAVSGTFLLAIHSSDGSSLAKLLFCFLFGLSTVSCIGIRIYKSLNNRTLEQQIALLPPESLPTVLPYDYERHSLINKSPTTAPTEKITYDIWFCKECGVMNSTKYAQCKKCGKYKSS